MNTEILGVALQIVLLIVISYPLGKYIAKVYKGENDKNYADSMCKMTETLQNLNGNGFAL